MRKAAHYLGGMDSSNPRRWRERWDKYERITFFNPKEGLKTLLFAPH